MLWTQWTWTFGFLGIVLLIHIFNMVRGAIQGNEFDNYYNSVFVAGNIYMFVIGIISIYFLSYYVENGVTRKNYFTAAFLAAVGIAITIPVVSFLVSMVEQLFFNPSFRVMEINSVVTDIDDSIIGYLIGSFVVSPYVDPTAHWLLSLAIFSLNLFIYYIFGWLISATFNRFRTIGGLATIVIGLIVVIFLDACIRHALQLPTPMWFSLVDFFSTPLTVFIILFLTGCMLLAIRLITSRAPIKI